MPSLISNSAFDDEEHEWVSDFDRYNQSKLTPGTGNAKNEIDGVEEIEQEMKLLNWHKLANEAALKAALIKTKRLRDTDRRAIAQERTIEQAQWMQQILEEEQRKPLEVTADFIKGYEDREKQEEERIENEVNRHITSLKRLKLQLKAREETRMRSHVYREKRNQLRMQRETSASEPDPTDGGFYLTSVPESAMPHPISGNKGGVQTTLTKVITSLDKLVDLEKRISKLESDTSYAPTRGIADKVTGNPKSRTNVVFHKKRVPSSVNQVSRTTYSVSIQERGKRLPNINNNDNQKRKKRVEAKIKLKHARDLREKKQNKRQDAVIKDWLNDRKSKNTSRRSRLQAKAQAIAEKTNTRKAVAGAPSQPQRMQQFHEIRKQFEKRKQELYKEMKPGAKKDTRGRGRTRTTTNHLRGGRSRTTTMGATVRPRRDTRRVSTNARSRIKSVPPKMGRQAWGVDKSANRSSRSSSNSRATIKNNRNNVTANKFRSASTGGRMRGNIRDKGNRNNYSNGRGYGSSRKDVVTRLPVIGGRRSAW